MQVQMIAAEFTPLATGAAGTVSRPTFRDLPGPFAIISSVLRNEGWRGLWLGHTGTLIRETGGGAAWFGANEIAAKFFMARHAKKSGRPLSEISKKDLSALELALSGANAGIWYNLALFPADTIKSTIQTEEELRPKTVNELRPRSTFLGTGKAIYRAQGIRGLYAGCGVTVARAVPSSAMIFLIYDSLKSHFGT